MYSNRFPLFGVLALLFAAVLTGPTPTIAGSATRVGGVIAGAPVWTAWRSAFVSIEGRVIDTGNRSVSHSEGQGYGMLLAVAAGDRTEFDRLWGWTRANLQVRSDNLSAWRWNPQTGEAADRNNATDGDILIAWALAEAADYWRADAYAAAGAAIARDIARKAIVQAPGVGPVLLPAAFGFSKDDQPDGPVVNLSYWVFPAFARLAQLAPDADWAGVQRSGELALDRIAAAGGLPSDWTSLADGRVTPARRYPTKFSYDAMRIPLYLSFARREHADRLTRLAALLTDGRDGVPVFNVVTGASDEVAVGAGYRAINASLSCASGRKRFPREFYRLNGADAYYPATLHMLALVAALTQSDDCLDVREARALQPAGWRPQLASLPQQAAQPQQQRLAAAEPPVSRRVLAAAPALVIEEPAENRPYVVGGLMLTSLLSLIGWSLSRRGRAEPPVESPAPQRSPAPRHLPLNPFNAARGAEAIEQRLEIAATASREWQRTAAVAWFRMAGYEAIEKAEGPAAAQDAVEHILTALRPRIRQSDAVAVVGPGEIAVCLSLIADQSDLESVGRRLSKSVREVHPLHEADECVFGLALYPPRGGSGSACVEAARSAFHAERPQFDFVERVPAKKPRKRAAAKAKTTVH